MPLPTKRPYRRPNICCACCKPAFVRPTVPSGFILLENGDYILLENGFKITLE